MSLKRSPFLKAAKLTFTAATLYLGAAAIDPSARSSAQTTPNDSDFSPFTSDLGTFNLRFNDLTYNEIGDGKSLFVPKGEDTNFYLYWKEMAKKNFSSSNESSFREWEEKSQKDYLDQLIALANRKPAKCGLNLFLCPNGDPFAKEANDLNEKYKISATLRTWDLQHMSRAYIAALMDPEIGEAIRNWQNLSRIQKMEIGKKLISYQFLAYREITKNHAFPLFKIEEKLDGAGAETDSTENKFAFSGVYLDTLEPEVILGVFWHEGRHRISAMLRDLLYSDNGIAYLTQTGILTDVRIDFINSREVYSNINRQDTSREANQAQAEEAISVNDELIGNILGARLLDHKTPDRVTVSLAIAYMYADLFNPAYPFKSAAAAEQLHAIFKEDWKEICYGVEKSAYGSSLAVRPAHEGCDGPRQNDISPPRLP